MPDNIDPEGLDLEESVASPLATPSLATYALMLASALDDAAITPDDTDQYRRAAAGLRGIVNQSRGDASEWVTHLADRLHTEPPVPAELGAEELDELETLKHQALSLAVDVANELHEHGSILETDEYGGEIAVRAIDIRTRLAEVEEQKRTS